MPPRKKRLTDVQIATRKRCGCKSCRDAIVADEARFGSRDQNMKQEDMMGNKMPKYEVKKVDGLRLVSKDDDPQYADSWNEALALLHATASKPKHAGRTYVVIHTTRPEARLATMNVMSEPQATKPGSAARALMFASNHGAAWRNDGVKSDLPSTVIAGDLKVNQAMLVSRDSFLFSCGDERFKATITPA